MSPEPRGPDWVEIIPGIWIARSELRLSFARSSGPGGQNVNKVNSKAVLKWNPAVSPNLPETARARILSKLRSRLSSEGELVISSDVYRDQPRNREECIRKLQDILRAALYVPPRRKPTRPSRSSRARAAEKKKKHSAKKRLRASRWE